MTEKNVTLTPEQKLAFYEQTEDLRRRVFDGSIPYESARRAVQQAMQPFETVKGPDGKDQIRPVKKRDLAERTRARLERWYEELGFKIQVPKPNVSNREFERRHTNTFILFYLPPSHELTFQRFNARFTSYEDRCVHHILEIHEERGYWFWLNAIDDSRIATRNELPELDADDKIPSALEYAIVSRFLERKTPHILKGCWLRTSEPGVYAYGQAGVAINGEEVEKGVILLVERLK